jgi:Tol biopolymer transport system component
VSLPGARSAVVGRRWGAVGLAAAAALVVLALASTACGGSGARQALIVYEARAADNVTNVWTIDAKTAASKQLTFGKGFDGNPGWSPDRRRIVFSSDRDSARNRDDIYVMGADGGNVQRLTDTPDVTEWSAKFSPDGTRISYVAGSSGSYYLTLMDADGSNQQHVAGPYKFAEFPSWRRDGKQVYFSAIDQGRGDADIYSFDIETHEVKLRISTPAADVCPHFTHDGKTLTYASEAPGDENKGNVDLFAHDLSSDDTTGARDTRLTGDPAFDDYGNPSPDDGTFVFLSDRGQDEEYDAAGGGSTNLYLMDRDGKHQRRLNDTPGVRENVPDW